MTIYTYTITDRADACKNHKWVYKFVIAGIVSVDFITKRPSNDEFINPIASDLGEM